MAADDSDKARGIGEFETTHWSIVLAAGRRSSPHSHQALSHLCGTYWYPLYVYARRRTRDADEARDLTQDFFATLLEKEYLAVADPQRGRFRAFLLTAFKNFLANEWERRKAQKRGGGSAPISLDFAVGESRYSREPADDLTPERIYERQWALTLLDCVLARLRDELLRAGKAKHFDRLKPFLTGHKAQETYADVARDLSTSEGAAKAAVYRMRRRYRELLRAEIAETVSGPSEVEDEIRSLFNVLGAP